MSTAHRLHRLIEIRERICGLLAQEEEHREAIISRAEAQQRETLTRKEIADFHAMSATIEGLQECVLDADVLIKELGAEFEASLPDAEVQPDCGATQPD